jgi:membrane-bound ClpP family serine protease
VGGIETQRVISPDPNERKGWRIKGLQELMIRYFRARAGRDAVSAAALFAAVLLAGIAPRAAALGQVAAEQDSQPADPNAVQANPPTTEPAPDAEQDAAPPAEPRREVELGDGRLIRVRLPLTGSADAHIKTTIDRAVEQLSRRPRPDERRPVLILELSPGRRNTNYGAETDFERALSVARHLRSQPLSAVKTVAYIPRTIKGHAVLIALACEEIVMSPEAEIGEAGINEKENGAIEPGIISHYTQIARERRTVHEAIVLGMLDPRREVLKVETEDGNEFVLREDLDELEREHTIVSQETLVPAGSLGLFSGREGREYGFVKLLANDRAALARGLALPPDAVIEDQALVGDWRPVRLNIQGPIEPSSVRQLNTLIGNELRDRRVNWIGITIDSTGGALEDCLRLADTIAALDANEVHTVAYVPAEASGGAALVALACDQLVMHPEAFLGGKGTVELDRQTLDAGTISIRDSLGQNTEHSWSILAAMIDPEVELFTYQNTKTGEVRHFAPAEADEQPDADDWRKGPQIKQAGEVWRIAANRAHELEVASHVVESFDEFKQLYGFESDPRVAEPNWALDLVEALSSPALAVLLLVVGFVGIYVELHTPGVGVGAFVAALAFMLFFWSNFLHGTAGWLEVLLFLGGIAFLLLELLILPGFGVFGLGGGAMILASLVLASQTFVFPHTELQRAQMRHSLTLVAAATVCVVAAALLLRRYLPYAPVFRTLLLDPTPEEELVELDYREALADFSHLLGQQGTATTNLMPAGKADFDGQLVDVIAEGMPIDRGATVIVVKTRGNRVVVRSADA